MSTFTDGGQDEPLFPLTSAAEHQFCGMGLRDYFAAMELSKVEGTYICDNPDAYENLAKHCYMMADAMMKERSK